MELLPSIIDDYDSFKPSFFELLSEQQLSQLLAPTARYLLNLATHRQPRYLLRIFNSFDECYALLSFLLERHFLKTYGGTFTEHFYGLKRVRALQLKGGEALRTRLGASQEFSDAGRLRDSDVRKNLVAVVLIPYLLRKLEDEYDVHVRGADVLGQNHPRNRVGPDASRRQRCFFCYKWFLRKVYPTVHALYYLSTILFYMAYTSQNSRYHSPLLWLVGTRIQRLEKADYRSIALAQHTQSGPFALLSKADTLRTLFKWRFWVLVAKSVATSSARMILPTSLFTLRLLEWWQTSGIGQQLARRLKQGMALPPPVVSGMPAPSSPPHQGPDVSASLNAESGASSIEPSVSRTAERKPPVSSITLLPIYTVPLPPSSAFCPICVAPMVAPAAAQTGFVFCYTCLYKWIEGTHDRQAMFMKGGTSTEGWDDDGEKKEGLWESGAGRCPITGNRLMSGIAGIRRVII